ncbi:MAG: hypothetical protein O3A51_02725 [Verrucomicrobia bacterium]|nr:hypothetical protein [Verrucomicrobiota bacterium]
MPPVCSGGDRQQLASLLPDAWHLASLADKLGSHGRYTRRQRTLLFSTGASIPDTADVAAVRWQPIEK